MYLAEAVNTIKASWWELLKVRLCGTRYEAWDASDAGEVYRMIEYKGKSYMMGHVK